MARGVSRRFGAALVVALAGLVTAGVSPVAADRLGYSTLSFQVCNGSTTTKADSFPMLRADVGASYADGHKAIFKVLYIEQPQNGHLTAKITDSAITLPGDWNSEPLDAKSSDTMSIEITFTATKQFTDGGRIRMFIDGNLESIDVPTFVMCAAAAAPADEAIAAPPMTLAAATSNPALLVLLVLLVGGAVGLLVAVGTEYLARRRGMALRGPGPAARGVAGILVGLLLALPVSCTLTAGPLANTGPDGSPGAGSPVAVGSAGPTAGGSLEAATLGPSPADSGASPSAEATASLAPTLAPSKAPAPAPTPAPPKLTATTDLYFAMDVEEAAVGQYAFDPLVNDLGPHPDAIQITAVTQLTIPAHYIQSGDTGTAQVGTLSVTADHKHLKWVDNICRTQSALCYSLPPLRFHYTISDGSKTDTGVGWLKFDRPWLIPFGFDRSLLVVPAAAASYIVADIPLPVLQATDISINGLPGVSLTLLEPCPADSTTACVIVVTAPTTGSLSGVLKPVSATELNAFVEFADPVDAGGGNVAILGMADFGTTGLCETIHVSYPELGFDGEIRTGCWDTSGTTPVSVAGPYTDAVDPSMVNSMPVQFADLSKPITCPGTPSCP